MAYELERVTPESVGIMSASITNLIETAKNKGIALHSLMIVRHGKVAAECYWKPYGSKSENHVYSFSKSFTSAAIGFAVAEGLLSYDDRVASFFPRYIDSSADQRIYSVTIEHLLTMTSGAFIVNEATVNFQTDWVKYFLNSSLSSFPGEKFNYNSINTYMLSAIIRKITGMGLVEYLTPRLFEPLGMSDYYWEKCPMGRECGGWGLHIKTEDMAKFGLLLLNDGVWDGKRILPEGWVALACSKHSNPSEDKKYNGHTDVIAGYGYQFWINRDNRGFRADGMLGQYSIVIPELDTVIVTTAGQMDQLCVLDLIWDILVPGIGLIPNGSSTGDDYDEFKYLSQFLCTLDTYGSTIPDQVYEISGVRFSVEPNRQSFIPFMCRYNKLRRLSGVSDVTFSFGMDHRLKWTECGKENELPLYFDGEFHDCVISFFDTLIPCSVYSRFLPECEKITLEVVMTLTDFPHSARLLFVFDKDVINITFNEIPSFTDSARFCGELVWLIRSMAAPLSSIAGKIASVTLSAKAD